MPQIDAKALGKEVTARNDFERLSERTMRRIAERPQWSLGEILEEWVRLLGGLSVINSAALLRMDNGGYKPVSCTGVEKEPFWESLEVDNRGNARVPHPMGLISVSPLRRFGSSVGSPFALAVFASGEHFSLSASLLELTVLRASATLQIIQEREARMEGLRAMAARMSYMCASSICLAQFCLKQLLDSPGRPVDEKLTEAMVLLEEAQQGFDRARLLGVHWTHEAEFVPVGELLREIAEQLRKTVGRDVVVQGDLDEVRGIPMKVRASRMRLRYALRDLLLNLWMFTGASVEERSAIGLLLAMRNGRIVLTLTASKAPVLKGKEPKYLNGFLRDPANYFVTEGGFRAERTLGFHLAWFLIEEIEGTMNASRHGDGLVIEIEFAKQEGAVQ